MSSINKIKVGDDNYYLYGNSYIGTCATAAATVKKEVVCADFPENVSGAHISVTFTYANTASNPTLSVNSKTACAIYANGAAINYSWAAGASVDFVFDGSHWVVESDSRVISSGSSVPSTGVKGQIYFIV